jgi:UDP-4-amino-4,6-dideoxy-N-acetyl-beta-L-altrosamine transaminase
MIPYGRQSISEEDITAVVDVLRSDYLTQGPAVPAFERALADYTGAAEAVVVNSATSALHLACLALGVGSKDAVWVPATTFVATANCARYCGANVDFVDVDIRTFNMDIDCLERKLEQASLDGNLPKVVIVVHMAGQPCDMSRVDSLSKKFNFNVIEDASHAVGSQYKNTATGSCEYSDITVFSFHPVKIITTAEGGAALTNSSTLASKMQLLRSHGVTRDAALMDCEPVGEWYYQQVELGFNYRMTDLQAALGLTQIKRLDSLVSTRQELVEVYRELLSELPIELPFVKDDCYSSFHLYIIRLNLAEISLDHKTVFSQLRSRGIGVNLHYMPVYLNPYYKKLGFREGYCPNAEEYSSCAISLPLHPGLQIEELQYVVDSLKEILSL